MLYLAPMQGTLSGAHAIEPGWMTSIDCSASLVPYAVPSAAATPVRVCQLWSAPSDSY